MSEFVDWSSVEAFSIIESACLIAGVSPDQYRHSNNRVLPPQVDGMLSLLRRAIKTGGLHPIELYVSMRDGLVELVDPNILCAVTDIVHVSSVVERAELLRWCKANHKPWPFADDVKADDRSMADCYPDELRAAIEVFEAVSRDPSATARRTPKAAIAAWLEKNKPELSSNARDRIATVANWQPAGGAPKTPGD